jgi:hypothetical protein
VASPIRASWVQFWTDDEPGGRVVLAVDPAASTSPAPYGKSIRAGVQWDRPGFARHLAATVRIGHRKRIFFGRPVRGG